MKLYNIILLSGLVVLSISGCKKDKDDISNLNIVDNVPEFFVLRRGYVLHSRVCLRIGDGGHACEISFYCYQALPFFSIAPTQTSRTWEGLRRACQERHDRNCRWKTCLVDDIWKAVIFSRMIYLDKNLCIGLFAGSLEAAVWSYLLHCKREW